MDYALNHRRALIDSAKPKMTAGQRADELQAKAAADLASKRIRAINVLGNRWVMHPQYNPARNTHHAPAYKTSAVLAAFNAFRGSRDLGRV